jgi:hypothetical protein
MDRADYALALSVVAIVPAVFSVALPSVAEVRRNDSNDVHDTAALKQATAVGVLLVAAATWATGSWRTAVLGGAAVALYVHAYRTAVAV